MHPVHIFIILCFAIAIGVLSKFLISGRKSLKIFPKLDKSDFEYIENFASGYSTKSFKTKYGGAKNVLQIRVRKNQLWLTSNTLLAWVLDTYDLLHLISIESLISVKSEGRNIKIEFEKNGRTKNIVIISRRKNELVRLLNDKMNNKK